MPTTIVSGNVYITTSTVSGSTINNSVASQVVAIHANPIEQDYNNALRVRPISQPKGKRDQEPITQIIDLKNITESLLIRGYLIDEDGESATTKKNNLINMGKTGGELTIVWNTGNYQTLWTPNSNARLHGVFIQTIKHTELPGSVGEAVSTTADINPPERKIAIQLRVIRGKDM